jgi:hypothetical protein
MLEMERANDYHGKDADSSDSDTHATPVGVDLGGLSVLERECITTPKRKVLMATVTISL